MNFKKDREIISFSCSANIDKNTASISSRSDATVRNLLHKFVQTIKWNPADNSCVTADILFDNSMEDDGWLLSGELRINLSLNFYCLTQSLISFSCSTNIDKNTASIGSRSGATVHDDACSLALFKEFAISQTEICSLLISWLVSPNRMIHIIERLL